VRANLALSSILGFFLASQAAYADNASPAATPAANPSSTSTSQANPSTNNPSTATTANAPATSGATVNPQQQQIESTVHQYLMKKPEVVVEALQAYQQKQVESMQQLFKDTQKLAPQYADALFHQDTDPMGGNTKGTLTLVEFSDYQCTHCIQVSPTVDAVIKANSNLRVVVKEFPIRGGISDVAARAALAANKQGKYWQFRDALFKGGEGLTQDKILEIAKTMGLNVDQLKKDMDDAAIRKAVDANQKLAISLKLVGTPAFFIAKSDVKTDAPSTAINYIPGVATQQQLQTIIDLVNKK